MGWKTNRFYLTIRQFVDRDLANNNRPISIFLAIIALLPAVIASRNDIPGGIIYWPISWLLAAAILLFAGWRAWRLGVRSSILGDRQYDRKTKYKLPAEYADSTSATETRRRRPREWRRR